MNTIKPIYIFLFLFIALEGYSQDKRSLTHDDYDGWESVSSNKISKNGAWAGFEINPQDGDGRLEIVTHPDRKKRYVINRGENWLFSNESGFAAGIIVPQKDSVKMMKLKETEKDDMPMDSLFILNLNSGNIEKLARIKSFSLPKKEGNWLAVHFEKDLAEKPPKKSEGDTTQVEKPKEKPKKIDGTLLIVRSLDGQQSYEYDKVKSYSFSENGEYLFYVQATEDSSDNSGIFLLELATGVSKIIDVGKTDYLSPSFSKENNYLAFMATEDSLKAKEPYFDLYLFEIKKEVNQKIADKNTPGILADGMISKNSRLIFSNDESRLFFGTNADFQQFAYEDDTTILEEERVSLDIWGWQDAEIQPMQLKNKSREERKSILNAYNIKDKKVIQIGDEKLNDINLGKEVKHPVVLATDDSPYRRNYSWDIQIGRDLYLVNLVTGDKTLIGENLSGNPQLSPEAKYAYWYDNRDSSWVVYDVAAKKISSLTKSMAVNFYNEQHDSPSLPGSYGNAGWMEDDKAFLVNDQYDIWKIDPTGKQSPLNITLGEGRKSKISFRRENLDEDEEYIDPKKPLILSAFHELNKKSGFFQGDIFGKKAPESLVFSDHRYYGLAKAEHSDKTIFRRSTYQESPEVYASDLTFADPSQLSFSNSQQENVKWGSVELVEYLANDGVPLQGLLYKPENFDPQKKYPLMVYFYERNSDNLHAYRAPAPSASTINIPYFVSNDYLVFVPDIKYDLGLPGPSAYNCIIPGVQSIIAKGYVDAENMAIQGQSWGGYQVAHLITRTNMFKAAGAGAPVVNMTSAYGGIRWGTGMSRMFQYEQTQSRIGGTLWEKPMYYLQNSPLFYMDRVETPVLIMHNDDDGSVPWYQGIEMFMALKRLGQPAWLLQYNGEDHNLKLRKNRKDLSIRLSQFFDHYLKGAPAPLWMTEGLPAIEKGRTLKYELEEGK